MADGEEVKVIPADAGEQDSAPAHFVLAPYVHDEESGGLWTLPQYQQVIAPFTLEDRKEKRDAEPKPASGTIPLGDVESFAEYVKRYGKPETAFLYWNNAGLSAVLDYHGTDGIAGRCQWRVEHKFAQAPQLLKWVQFVGGRRTQKEVIEFFEDMAETVVSPSAADLAAVLSTLRSNVTSSAEVTLKPDGGSKIEFKKDSQIRAQGELPPIIAIQVPVLAGHLDANGHEMVYGLTVRLRPSPTDNGVVFSFSIPNLQATLEDAYADKVATAREALGETYSILRAANS